MLLVKSHFICYTFKSICPLLGLSCVATLSNTHLNLSLMDCFFVVSTVTSLPVRKNAVYTSLFWMITFIFKRFQRLSEERSIKEDMNTHSKKYCLLTLPFSLGIQNDYTWKWNGFFPWTLVKEIKFRRYFCNLVCRFHSSRENGKTQKHQSIWLIPTISELTRESLFIMTELHYDRY